MKRLLGRGNPDASAIRAGYAEPAAASRLSRLAGGDAAWLAGPQVSLADFAAAGASLRARLHRRRRLVAERGGEGVVRAGEVAALLPRLLADRVSGVDPPAHYADLDF